MNKIAIIEDDIDICNMIVKFLENNKYSVHYALNGTAGIELCKSLVPDLIILDIMLPNLNGNDVLQRLRKFTNAPVIVVSAKTMVQTKIDLLKLGADDYMTKPFDLHELLARIEANLKRTSNTSCQNDTLTYRDIEINNSLVYIKEILVPFTSTELKILRLLLQYPQKIFSNANCKCKLDTCTVELSESERRSGWKPLASVLGDAAAAFGCVNRVEELVKQLLRGAVAKLLARPSVQFISCSQDILSRESLNGHALRNEGSKQPVVTFVLGTFPRGVGMRKVDCTAPVLDLTERRELRAVVHGNGLEDL